MASNYTCRACARALSRCPTRLPWSQTRSTARAPIAPVATFGSLPPHAPARRHASTAPRNPRPATISAGIAAKARKAMPLTTETYVAYGSTEDMIKECAAQGDYSVPQAREKAGVVPVDETGAHVGVGDGWWYQDLGLPATFVNWVQITFIHMYMMQVRLRMLPETHSGIWIQHLTNHMSYAAEDRLVVWHSVTSTSVRQKYLKDNFALWRAVLMSYDEALVKGDAEMAAAVWRNLFAGREEFMDYERLAQIVAYIRREIKRLEAATDDEVASGLWKFEGNPGSEARLVARPSPKMRQGEKA